MPSTRRIPSFRLHNPTLSGLWYAFLWMMIGALVLSLFLHFNVLEESQLPWWTYVIHSISIFIGGVISGKRAKQRGLYQGFITGLIYGIVLLLVSFLALDTSLSLSDLSLLIPAGILGAVGGVLGVNLKGES